MNDHEAQRIASAMHQLRPDWPARQILTLLADERMRNRPRRDVVVALGWVACEPATNNPYRALESGPWWKATAVEGGPLVLNQVERHERCSVCSLPQDRCRSRWGTDHDFVPDVRTEATDTTSPASLARQALEAARIEKQATTEEHPMTNHQPTTDSESAS